MKRVELLDHNIWMFINKTNETPNSIILNPIFVNGLINEHKEHIEFINTEDRLPIKYRGIRVYECPQFNEEQIELTFKL